jgi:hypothetical protein
VGIRLVDGGVDVTVDQTQTTGPASGFSFPLDIDLVKSGLRHRVTIEVTGKHMAVHASVPFVPAESQVDPDVMLYAHTQCRAPIPCR